MKLAVKTKDRDPQEITVDQKSITLSDLAEKMQKDLPYEIFHARIDGEPARLCESVDRDCTIELLDMRDSEANLIYQKSVSFLYIHAVHEVLGSDVPVEIHNSLSKGVFTVIRTNKIEDRALEEIQACMQRHVDRHDPFLLRTISRREFLDIARKSHRKDLIDLIETAYDLRSAYACTLDKEETIYYEKLVPDCSYLRWFEVRKYKNGVLLRFPHPSRPDELMPYEEQPLLYSAFSEANRWDKIMGVNYASDLNEYVLHNGARDLILTSEALHEKKIAEIAEQIREAKKRIILIAGPSSSGKTTFANRLCIQLRVAGLRPLYLGTDDYFLEREQSPVGPDGKKDYEGLNALDRELFNQQMNDLLNGRKVDLPRFDFVSGHKIYGERITSIDASQPVVIEGLHCLNPKLTEQIPDNQKFKIYISPLTQINIDAHNRIPTTDTRLLRRMVRDANFRGASAARTIDSWPSVRTGEDKNIFPFNQEADVFFNSNSLYELAVMKKYAEPQLKRITEEQPEYPEAQRMLRFLRFFVPIEDDSLIPNNSIIREFIGGSVIVK